MRWYRDAFEVMEEIVTDLLVSLVRRGEMSIDEANERLKERNRFKQYKSKRDAGDDSLDELTG